jgi:hypothetical protein
MWTQAILFLFFFGAVAAEAKPRLGHLLPAQIDAFLSDLQRAGIPLAERIERVSARFLGTRYVRDPLGEGKGGHWDPDPLIDLNRVDCLTFVEQVLALAQRTTLNGATSLLATYRYDGGQVSYRRRRHFMELQWLPGLVRVGLLRDLTPEVAGDAARTLVREVTRESYRGAFRRWPRRLGGSLPLGSIRLSYVPTSKAPALAGKIPPGTIMALVRRTPESWPVVVTHVGFVVRRAQELVFRHAIHVAGRVIDEPLDRYIARHARDPRSLGFHLAEAIPAPPQAAPQSSGAPGK